MTFTPLEVKPEAQRQQLFSRVKKLEVELKRSQEINVALKADLEARSDYEDLVKEIEDLRKENANLKRSNTMLKKSQTS